MSALVQGSPEWLEFRRSRIGASDIPIIMEVSPWKTPYQLWLEKIGETTNAVNSAMQRGTDMEETARQAFILETGIAVFPDVRISNEYEWMIASLDGINAEGTVILEIKCPGHVDHNTALAGNVPDKYYPQLQHQMFVTGLDKVHYYSYTPLSTKIIVVNRDDKYIAKMIKREKEFYDCMIDFIPPKLIAKDFINRTDDIWVQAANSWLELQQKKSEILEQEEELRESLIRMSGNSNTQGAGIKLSKIIRKGNVDYKEIPELKNVDLDKYRKEPLEMWRIS